MSLNLYSAQSPTKKQIQCALDQILQSRVFARAQRSKQLLKYLVEQSLADRRQELNEYAIGISVFCKTEDFDPQLDNIVRINGGRLRKKLAEYYQSEEGKQASVIVEIPTRSYVPDFRFPMGPPPRHQVIHQLLENAPERLISQQHSSLSEQEPNQSNVRQPVFKNTYLVSTSVALVVLLIALSTFLWFKPEGEHRIVDVNSSVERQLADRYFVDKSYEKALFYYQVALQKQPDDTSLLKQIARCQLYLNQIPQANQTLQLLLSIEQADSTSKQQQPPSN